MTGRLPCRKSRPGQQIAGPISDCLTVVVIRNPAGALTGLTGRQGQPVLDRANAT